MAMAPEQTGIGIHRHFTVAGQDPYDTVVWERRDARISHYATGAVAFEQPGVEVPSGWSINATNILAQKYFRGTLGSPEREWSLRQVADRVVDTVTAWGRKDGYFVDEEEAQTFSDELKYLIIHQRAAFNSPVWFNIGVKGVPQQGSACQPYDALVNTPDGPMPIGRLVETAAVGTKVFDAHGLTRIVAVKANGRKAVLRLRTKAGVTLDVTGDHLVWRRSGQGTGSFVPASQLLPGDQLSWYPTGSVADEILDQPGDSDNAVRTLDIAAIEERGDQDVYDIQTESGEYLSGNLRVHNCFILSVDDSMDSILDWYKEEGIIFKGGSGAGVNLSRIRSSQEHLRGGGTASGPVSFMRGADASAGTIKSGGKTRRAAKMVILNVDHPDIEDFIWCKAVEERKARVLRDAGFDMDLDGKDSHSTQYQNANNSIRVTDEFMNAVVDDGPWDFKAVTTGEVIRTVQARDLFRQMAKATWECADPGMQFDTTINKWHTTPNFGRINGSNPCFAGDALVHTDKGLIAFKELFARANEGESFGVWTHDATNPDDPQERVELTKPEAFMITGTNEIVRLRFSNGMEIRCTVGHRLFTINRGYVEAGHLTPEDRVKVLDLPAPALRADYRLPVSSDVSTYSQLGDHRRPVNLPEKWSPELAHYLGWLVGDGSFEASGTISAIYGSAEDQESILPRHSQLVTWLNGGQRPRPSPQGNGTVQQRLSRRSLSRFFSALGLSPVRGPAKRVPTTIFQAPTEIVGSFLQGLFDADGCVRRGATSSYVGLESASRPLLVDVQRLLSTLGVTSTIYPVGAARQNTFTYTKVDVSEVSYNTSAMFDLRITCSSVADFARSVGFLLPSKADKLSLLIESGLLGIHRCSSGAKLVERAEDGFELTYNLSEPRNHSYSVNGLVVRNCSEYMHVDNSACNLASLNLLTFLQPDGSFDIAGFKTTIETIFTAQEILVGNADYPTEAIAENSRRFRQLGIGYANLGALLMAQGLAYDSDGGRAWAGAITALLTGHAYATSARTAARMGPFAGYTQNREATLDVLRMHRDAAAGIDEELVPPELLSAAQSAWDGAVETAGRNGVRNAQSSVLAPTGTIALLMDCDTTGIEPDLGLVKVKKLVGGGTMSIVNQTVPRALAQLGYDKAQSAEILDHIDEHKSILGAPHLSAEHLEVFACSMGDNTIHYRGHVRMMGAVQPFISGAISKTVNMPEQATVEDVEQLHIEAWQLGLKAVAIYRDNCKVAQPLATAKRTAIDPNVSAAEAHDAELAVKVAELEEALSRQTTVVVKQPIRERMPRRRRSSTFAFRVADCEGFVTVGEYEDGRPGEVFMKVAKQGSTLAGIMDAFAISVSLGLQHGVPLATYVRKYTSMRFEPAGMTDDPDLRIAQSLVDYIFRRLAVDYMSHAERLDLGVLTSSERTQQTLPGVDEAVTPNQSIVDDRLDLDGHTGPSTRNEGMGPAAGPVAGAGPVVPPARAVMPESADAPYCYQCGVQMQRAGSCHACPSCGTTSGCS